MILPLDWSGVQAAQLPNFETQARRLRYQALGNACRDRKIQSLLLAHHEDDQAETLLLRLAQGHRGMGLMGMQDTAQIPECCGIHGVHQSGSKELGEKIPTVGLPNRTFFLKKKISRSQKADSPMPFEDGGIQIHRPLLNFSKRRLKATCDWYKIRWIEDETNRDPTRTPRNAVRQLLHSKRLPLSLQKASLLDLRKRISDKMKNRVGHAQTLFRRCEISMLDTRSGALVVRLPSCPVSRPIPPEHLRQRLIEREYTVALMLRKILYIVSPQEGISLQSLNSAVKALFPNSKDRLPGEVESNQQPLIFTTAGVSFQRVLSPLQLQDGTKRNQPNRLWLKQKSLDPDFVWILTRQPFHSTIEIPTIKIQPDPQSLQNSTLSQRPFHLWDSRYWIRVQNASNFLLLIRPLRPQDLVCLRSSRTQSLEVRELDTLLRVVAPGKIRWTLPVIVIAGLRERPEEVLGLPSLEWGHSRARELGVLWEIRYKKVYLGLGASLRDAVI